MGNKNSVIRADDHTQVVEPQNKHRKSFKNKNLSTTNIHKDTEISNGTKRKKQKDKKRSKSSDNLADDLSSLSYTPSVFKSPSNPPTDPLGNKQLSCIIMPDQQVDIKVLIPSICFIQFLRHFYHFIFFSMLSLTLNYMHFSGL